LGQKRENSEKKKKKKRTKKKKKKKKKKKLRTGLGLQDLDREEGDAFCYSAEDAKKAALRPTARDA